MKYPKVAIEYVKTKLNAELALALEKRKPQIDKAITKFTNKEWKNTWIIERIFSNLLEQEVERQLATNENLRKKVAQAAMNILTDTRLDKKMEIHIRKYIKEFFGNNTSFYGNQFYDTALIKKLIDRIEMHEFDDVVVGKKQ